MSYEEWIEDHDIKVNNILKRLSGKGIEETVSYFNYENMKDNELDFCPLYKNNSKCHDIDELNCLLCACPHFHFNNETDITKRVTIASTCTISSRFKGEYYANPDENGVIKVHCDCTDCFVPHRHKYTVNYLTNKTKGYVHSNDCNSLLEYIRTNNILKG